MLGCASLQAAPLLGCKGLSLRLRVGGCYVFNNPLSFTDPSGFVSMSSGNIYDDYDGRHGDYLQPGECAPGDGDCRSSLPDGADTEAGSDAWYWGLFYQQQQHQQRQYQPDYSQLPTQIMGAPHYAQGQHLLDQDAKVLQAGLVAGGVSLVVSAKGLVVAKLAHSASKAEKVEKIIEALKAGRGIGSLTKSQQRAIRGLEEQISAHQKKLADFKANPGAFDNKGFLKNASPELREKIIQSRINSLEKQIDTFRKDIDAIIRGLKDVLEKQ